MAQMLTWANVPGEELKFVVEDLRSWRLLGIVKVAAPTAARGKGYRRGYKPGWDAV
jgi:hypothetical protein